MKGDDPRVDEHELLTDQFERHTPHLRAVAHRILGSTSEAEDALQEAWLRVREQDPDSIENLQAWLTTVVSRVCLNLLRARRRRQEVLSDFHVPDPVVTYSDGAEPEQEALLGDSVGLALLVVLDTLTPAERLAFVLHDVFGMPFADIAAVLERSEVASQQLASRARRRLRGSPEPDRDLTRQRTVVDAFFAASRDGDFDALISVLDPDVELRVDGGVLRAEASLLLRGSQAVAGHTATYSDLYPYVRPALVNAAAGAVVTRGGRPFSVMAFTVVGGRIARIDALVDPVRIATVPIPPSGD